MSTTRERFEEKFAQSIFKGSDGSSRFITSQTEDALLTFIESEVKLDRAELLKPSEPSPELANAEKYLRESTRDDRCALNSYNCRYIVQELDRLRAENSQLSEIRQLFQACQEIGPSCQNSSDQHRLLWKLLAGAHDPSPGSQKTPLSFDEMVERFGPGDLPTGILASNVPSTGPMDDIERAEHIGYVSAIDPQNAIDEIFYEYGGAKSAQDVMINANEQVYCGTLTVKLEKP